MAPNETDGQYLHIKNNQYPFDVNIHYNSKVYKHTSDNRSMLIKEHENKKTGEYQLITNKIFERLEKNIVNKKVPEYNCIDDILLDICEIVKKEFKCCDEKNMNFEQFINHVFKFHRMYNEKNNLEKNKNHKKKVCKSSVIVTKILQKKLPNHYAYNHKRNNFSDEKCKQYRCFNYSCNKSFKSINGLKYHLTYGHKHFEHKSKYYDCTYTGCGKRYKNQNGLKYHLSKNHK